MLLTEEYLKATMHTKEEENRQARLISEAREEKQPNRNARVWRWRIEPGMEGEFKDLQGWLLCSQRDAEVERANSPPQARPSPQPSPSPAREHRPASQPRPLRFLQRLMSG